MNLNKSTNNFTQDTLNIDILFRAFKIDNKLM